jgi:hypothetical protein
MLTTVTYFVDRLLCDGVGAQKEGAVKKLLKVFSLSTVCVGS